MHLKAKKGRKKLRNVLMLRIKQVSIFRILNPNLYNNYNTTYHTDSIKDGYKVL